MKVKNREKSGKTPWYLLVSADRLNLSSPSQGRPLGKNHVPFTLNEYLELTLVRE